MTAFACGQIPSYNVIDLGTLGGTGAAARAVNNHSVVTGLSAVGTHQHAFRWKEVPAFAPPGTVAMTDLGLLPTTTDSDGRNIAPDGSVAGLSGNFPVLWSGGGVTQLPPVVTDNQGIAQAVRGGTVVGYINRLVPGSGFVGARAVKWKNGKATELHLVNATFSQATDINASGQIAGWANMPPFFGEQHARIWDSAGTSDLHGGFATKTRSLAFALNASGSIAGTAFTTSISSDPIPVRASVAGGMIALPLPVGTSRGQAYDINADGAVVGFGDPGNVAMLWLPDTTPVVLQSRIPAGSGWTLQIAYSINDHGEIAGVGIFSGTTRAFLLRPTTYHPGAVETELIDPAAPEPEPTPGYPLLTDGDITTDKSKLATSGQPAIGLVADGTTRLLLRFTTSHPGTVTVSFPGAGDDQPPATGIPERDGWLGLPGVKPATSSVTASTSNIGGNNLAFAVYRAPEELPAEFDDASTYTLYLKVRFDGPAGIDPSTDYVAVRVDRPPVLAMHGLWSNFFEAYKDFTFGVKQQIHGLYIDGPDYPNAAHFSANHTRVTDHIRKFREARRLEKIAMCQADVVGHSMGGLLGRLWASDDASLNRTNYGEGEINRLITIDSPHYGAILMAAAWELRQFAASLGPTKLLLFDGLFITAGMPLGGGAVEDLSINSAAITDLTGRTTHVRSHTIAGDTEVPVDLGNPLVTGPMAPLYVALDKWGVAVAGNIPVHSDLLVGLENQLGGLVLPTTDKHDHIHSGAANKPLVINDCVQLLRTRPSASSFADGFPIGCPPQPPIVSGTFRTLRTLRLLISLPIADTIVTAGTNTAVSVVNEAESELTSLLILFGGTISQITSVPWETTVAVPVSAAGSVTLQVLGTHADGSISLGETILQVVSSAALNFLTATPAAIPLYSLDNGNRARIEGSYADGVTRDLTAGATGTTYLSSNTAVVTVDADGWLTPVANGSATVTATNNSKSATIAVTVALVTESDLALAGPGSALAMIAGESTVLTFAAENHGPDSARPADVFVSGPPAVFLTAATASAGAWTGGDSPAWSVATLANAGSATLSVTVSALAPGSGTLVATITGTGRDFSTGNNALSIPVRVFANPHLAFGAGGDSVHFTTESGISYTLETSVDLAPGHWIPSGTVTGDGTEKSIELPPTTEPRLFHRLRLAAP